jgi:mono/diheme cytochrome c family protein
MKKGRLPLASAMVAAAALIGCDALPGRPKVEHREMRPDEQEGFAHLYAQNCAGCHGPDGKGNAALALANPVYLAIADDALLKRVITSGVAGTQMPAFARTAGGTLTDKQVEILVQGIRGWAQPLPGAVPPPYAATSAGDAGRGAQVYAAGCASCHGPEGRGGPKAGSIVDGSYLHLVGDQGLRTTVIAGRPDLAMPDWRGYVTGQPLAPQQISDVTAWLVAQRRPVPGRLADQAGGPVKRGN